MSQVPDCLKLKEEDVRLLLACNVHLGTKNVAKQMERYIFKRRADGVQIIDLAKTWEKIVLAARIIVTVENSSDIAVICSLKEGQRAVLKYAQYTGANSISSRGSRFTPGTFTNQIQEKFVEPRVLVLGDPRLDHQPLAEAAYVNIPTIAFCNTDSPTRLVDVVIPCNNRGTEAIACMWFLLAREVLRLRGTVARVNPWEVLVDVFIYKPPEEAPERKGEEQAAATAYVTDSEYKPTETQSAHEGGHLEWAQAPAEGGAWSESAAPGGAGESWGQQQQQQQQQHAPGDWVEGGAEQQPAQTPPPPSSAWDQSH